MSATKAAPSATRDMTEAEMLAWGRAFGAGVQSGRCVVTLSGDLGSGKTTLAQAIGAGYGVTEDITSPTYAIVHKYASSKSPMYHLDLYRLDGPRDLQNIGFDEIVSSVSFVLIEWPERAASRLPEDAIGIRLAMVDGDPTRRSLTVDAPYLNTQGWRRWWPF